MDQALVVKNLSKRFFRNPDIHGRHTIRDLAREVLGFKKVAKLRGDEFYAVHGLSFELKPGESIALIGRNGCGKTTALKLITGLLKPDFGSITSHGNIQALIALGAGFNPKLSGRENIVNSAAVLGLKAKQIGRIVSEIIEYSELEEFIDGPVRTYSSGMYARLGFSVAVHLNPDILIIDEILGVGDYAFQNKCFLRMQELKRNGTTIVLVSHSQSKVVQMCEKAIWLERGVKVMEGESKLVVDKYIKSLEAHKVNKEMDIEASPIRAVKASEELYGPIHHKFDYITNLNMRLAKGSGPEYCNQFQTHDEMIVDYSFTLIKTVTNLNVSFNIMTVDGRLVTTISTLNDDLLKHKKEGDVVCKIKIKDLCLSPGKYVVTLPIHDGLSYLFRDVVARFDVLSGDRMTWGQIDLDYQYEVK